MLNDQTKQVLALEMAPKTPSHRARFAVAFILVAAGLVDFLVNGVIRDVERSIAVLLMDGALIFGGLTVAFTKTMLEIAKTVLPFIKR
ncbi:MAG: hypothetical protein ACYTEX_26275 [Planctomycetota bacterium]|jgi:hypothetical protein